MTDRLGPYLLGPNDTPENGIYTGDARELAKAIPDESVDLIFTDPPYGRQHLSLYRWLAQVAKQALKPEAFVLAMCGGLYLDRIFAAMSELLTYFWKYEVELTGWAAGCIWPRGNNRVNIVSRCKPILAYSKGEALPRVSTLGLFKGTGEDKRYHVWGQDEASVRYYVDCFSRPAEVVWDPFCGGGTTPAVCKMLGRRWLAFEIDPHVAETARERVRMTQIPLFRLEPEQRELVL